MSSLVARIKCREFSSPASAVIKFARTYAMAKHNRVREEVVSAMLVLEDHAPSTSIGKAEILHLCRYGGHESGRYGGSGLADCATQRGDSQLPWARTGSME